MNRVAAEAVMHFAAGGVDRIVRVLAAVVDHLTTNCEVHGHALFLNAAVDSLQLEAEATTSPRVQDLLRRLGAEADRVRLQGDRIAGADAKLLEHERLISSIGAEMASVERGHRRWLQGHVDNLAQQYDRSKQDLTAARSEAEARRVALETAREDLRVTRADLGQARQEIEVKSSDLVKTREGLLATDADLVKTREDLRATDADLAITREDLRVMGEDLATARKGIAALQVDLAGARAATRAVQELRDAVAAELVQVGRERDTFRISGEESASELGAVRQRLAEMSAALATLEARRAQLELARDALVTDLRESTAALGRETVRADRLDQDKASLQQERTQLEYRVEDLRAQIAALRASREFRTGSFVWNKLPLGYLSRRGKKWYRRLLDLKDRIGLLTWKRGGGSLGNAVVAAVGTWPVYTHSFVYQELLGLGHMGLDVRLFHWSLGDGSLLPKDFQVIDWRRVQLQPIPEIHRRDMRHFEKTKPGRLRAFLERVALATGRSVESLEKEAVVLQGCTFARMAEVARATYLHSYFFYDQSFMAMLAAWLLGLPRGITCYADHMLNDYPFKLVALHVELADVVVATSARVRQELVLKSSQSHHDKVLVKPNGVDGRRFPRMDREMRGRDEILEVVSVSRIEPKKGLTYLVDAVADLKRRGRKVLVHVVGERDHFDTGGHAYAAKFELSISQLGLEKEIVLHGAMNQDELLPILRRCRVFVAPYVELESGDKDGIPTAMLEAMATGMPVVTTDSGSIGEAVSNEVEALVVPQRDSKRLADAIERLIVDPELEIRLGRAGNDRFVRQFDVATTEKALHDRIAELLATKRGV
ncbi:MAG: glycosyltransferase [Planctomycetes bacterium]|nr:glycosyltransferase [Planctomycetota bacterium]